MSTSQVSYPHLSTYATRSISGWLRQYFTAKIWKKTVNNGSHGIKHFVMGDE